MIYGNIQGVKNTILDELEQLIQYQIEKDKLLDEYIVSTLLNITEEINKELLVIVDSSNKILSVSIGDDKTSGINTANVRTKRRGLNGLKCFHTHPNGNPYLSSPDFSSLQLMKFDMMGAIGINRINEPLINIGLLVVNEDEVTTEEFGPFTLGKLNSFNYNYIIEETDKFLKRQPDMENDIQEKAALIGININGGQILDIDDSMNELWELTKTVGAMPTAILVQNKERMDNRTYLGKGKLEELRLLIQNNACNLVVCNDELSSIQIKVMETLLGVKVIDRTSLILDIFARHAKTSEGKLQVELAQLKYRLPRLQGLGKVLSRTGGGIGTRGPGEKKLEIDRRSIYREVNILESKIKNINKIRQQQKQQRKKNTVPQVALVGYTNAGKSTLFNLLTDSEVLSENKLFATLDSTVRKFKNIDRELLLSDTVGFIDKLPHELVNAFKSTLEDVSDAELLLHVVDSSNPKFPQQIQLVKEVLASIGCDHINTIYVFNKIDSKCDDFEMKYTTLRDKKVKISAKFNEGIDELLKLILNEVYGKTIIKDLKIPYGDSKYIANLHALGVVQDETYLDEFVHVKVKYSDDLANIINKYSTGDSFELSDNKTIRH